MKQTEKYCQTCGQYKPVENMSIKKVVGYNYKKVSVLRCNLCWEKRGR